MITDIIIVSIIILLFIIILFSQYSDSINRNIIRNSVISINQKLINIEKRSDLFQIFTFSYSIMTEDNSGNRYLKECKIGFDKNIEWNNEEKVIKEEVNEKEENYPHKIGLFTTRDEDELTERYIQLINEDDKREVGEEK
jgi:hypothetical protein